MMYIVIVRVCHSIQNPDRSAEVCSLLGFAAMEVNQNCLAER